MRGLAVLLLVAGGVGDALAQTPPNLLGAATGAAGERIVGMRAETVGAVERFSLSLPVLNGLAGNVARQVRIALPGGQSVTCELRSQVRDGMTVLSGAPLGGDGRCDLVAANGQVTGDLSVGSERYRIQPLGAGNAHAVVEFKTGEFPNEREPKQAVPGPDERRGRLPGKDDEPCDVPPKAGESPRVFGPLRLLMLYTPATRSDTPNIRADVELIMQQFRRAYDAANIGGNFSVTVELAHAAEVNYTEGPNMDADLDRLTNPRDPVLRVAHALRDTHKADLVHMLIKSKPNDGCGIGWLNMQLRAQDGFSISDHQCAIGQFSAVHEIGHGLGMNHDRFVVEKNRPGPAEYNFGFVALEQGVRSIMAYRDMCDKARKPCPRQLFLSSPNVRVKGAPFGAPIDRPNAAYNVETLCRTAPAVANFR
jgi:hypothetical protein